MLGVKNPPANAGDIHGFDAWVGKIPWRNARQPTPVFLSRESYKRRRTYSFFFLSSQQHIWVAYQLAWRYGVQSLIPNLALIRKKQPWDLPGVPMAKSLLPTQGTQVGSLVRELDPTCHNKEFICCKARRTALWKYILSICSKPSSSFTLCCNIRHHMPHLRPGAVKLINKHFFKKRKK